MRTAWPIFLVISAACSSPAAGGWRGTADVGPVTAFDLELSIQEDGTAGRIAVREPGKPFTHQWFQLCSVKLEERAFTAVYDATHPDCAVGKDNERRTLKGTVGEGVIWGDLLRGENSGEKMGFFRAFEVRELPATVTTT